jgi:OFA family oxalate/formate antiporter-like MFS transporter
MCIKWYPDRRGFIVGLAVMGFGVGPLLFGPLIEWLIGSDPAAFTQTIPKTFFILAALFVVGVTGAAQFYRVPPAGWRPPNWNAHAATSAVARRELAPGATLSTWQFYALWLLYFLGTSVGLTAIGEASPLLRQMAAKGGAPLTAGTALGIMSIFNGAGRLGWGAVSDRMGRKAAVLGMCAGSVIACLAFLRAPAGFTPLLAGLCLAAFCYGGYLALMPSFTADFFGPKHVGANYGLLFTAWGICGFVIPGYFAGIMDRARTAGNLQSGYDEVYFTLAALSLAGAVVCAILRPPQTAS